MFARKIPLTRWKKIQNFFWPGIGWRRWYLYIWQRLLRISDTSHKIALGFACGVLVSFTPFVGLHFVFAVLLAWVLGGSILAGLLGTAAGNPVTFPFFWASSYGVGNWILKHSYDPYADDKNLADASIFSNFSEFAALIVNDPAVAFGPIFVPATIGALIIGLPVSIIVYIIIKYPVEAYRKRRLKRLHHRKLIQKIHTHRQIRSYKKSTS